MHELDEYRKDLTRRHFFARAGTGIGAAALGGLLMGEAGVAGSADLIGGGVSGAIDQRVATARRVIYLFQSGAPSQLETFDHKPGLGELQGTDLPDSIRRGQRVTGMTSGQSRFPVAASKFPFERRGQAGTWVSSLLPHTGRVVDDLCVVRSLHTEAINHDPAITLLQTGSQQPGRPSMGAWISYGLGTENEELPTFMVLISQTRGKPNPQGLLSRLWTGGFLPSRHQGVKLRSASDPVLFLSDPPGLSRGMRRDMLDRLATLNAQRSDATGDPEIRSRITQYEMAFRMQTSVPDLVDLSSESSATLDMYGPDSRQPGTFAANCLLARRLAERGVRFIQLYHRGWDAHGNLPKEITALTRETDQPAAALITDLGQRGLLDDTLVVWSGEFGRSVYCQGKLTRENYGRDHHGRCFSGWLAGGGIRGGVTYGETDDYSYNIVRDGVHVHDLQATILRCLGIDHERLVFKYQGRQHRLTDVHGQVVEDILN